MFFAFYEFIDQCGFSNASATIDDAHLECILCICIFKTLKLAFSSNKMFAHIKSPLNHKVGFSKTVYTKEYFTINGALYQ